MEATALLFVTFRLFPRNEKSTTIVINQIDYILFAKKFARRERWFTKILPGNSHKGLIRIGGGES
jgi:hypothetical protein